MSKKSKSNEDSMQLSFEDILPMMDQYHKDKVEEQEEIEIGKSKYLTPSFKEGSRVYCTYDDKKNPLIVVHDELGIVSVRDEKTNLPMQIATADLCQFEEPVLADIS